MWWLHYSYISKTEIFIREVLLHELQRVQILSSLDSDWYVCDSCDEFSVHVLCAALPASTTRSAWDKHHLLLLTYDANLNHPGEFYCDECETQMNPKSWMYQCRHSDLWSFHPNCFKTTSGEYRNIKFGHSVNALAHPHPLAYQLLTTKRCCNLCGEDKCERRGFHCALCNFFICFSSDCGAILLQDGDIQAVEWPKFKFMIHIYRVCLALSSCIPMFVFYILIWCSLKDF